MRYTGPSYAEMLRRLHAARDAPHRSDMERHEVMDAAAYDCLVALLEKLRIEAMEREMKGGT